MPILNFSYFLNNLYFSIYYVYFLYAYILRTYSFLSIILFYIRYLCFVLLYCSKPLGNHYKEVEFEFIYKNYVISTNIMAIENTKKYMFTKTHLWPFREAKCSGV